MLSGGRTGLLTGVEVVEEDKRRRTERETLLANMDPEMLGKGAQTVYRDKLGRKLTMEEVIKMQDKDKKEEPEEKYEWGGGLVQKK